MASFDQRNKKSLANITNPLEMMKGALSEDVRLPSIVEFAEHPSFLELIGYTLDKKLY